MKFKIKDTELCTFCNETKETILHHLFECIHVKNIWIKLASNVRSNLNININLLPEYFVFNMFTGQEDESINTCILLLKNTSSIANVKALFQLLKKE